MMVDPLVNDLFTASQSETVPNLILVPTPLELSHLMDFLPESWAEHHLEICGFGPIASAARTSQLLGARRYDRVFLVGIAGAYSSHGLTIGQAYLFQRVRCHGVGVGSGHNYQSAEELGWNHIDLGKLNQEQEEESQPLVQPVGDLIDLSVPRTTLKRTQPREQEQTDSRGLAAAPVRELYQSGTLLTGCTASADATEANQRTRRYPDATAEDMEGFGVALACHLHGIPLTIIRGVSNTAGNRDHHQWQIPLAMKSVAELLFQVVADCDTNSNPTRSVT